MDYATAKAEKARLESICRHTGAALNAVPGVGSGPMGLTPDSVKAGWEYRNAKADFDRAFAELKRFNAWFVKEFAKEYRAERRKCA